MDFWYKEKTVGKLMGLKYGIIVDIFDIALRSYHQDIAKKKW